MKNIILLFAGILISSISFSQSVERQLISPYGGDYNSTANDFSIDYSVGEIAVSTYKGSAVVANQGYQQRSFGAVGLADRLNLAYDINLYPNPVSEVLTIEIKGDWHPNLRVNLKDMLGREVELKSNDLPFGGNDRQLLDLSQLANGQYIIVFTLNDEVVGIEKIIKN